MNIKSRRQNQMNSGQSPNKDSERYVRRRQKMYTFMKIPRELEKFMSYGFFHCVDSFLFVFTFLPVRFALAIASMIWRAPRYLLG